MHNITHLWVKSAALVGVVVVSACQWAGEGPVTLSNFSATGWEEYEDIVGEKAFALTEDGSSYGYAFCTDVRCSGNEANVALQSCERGATAQGLAEGQCRLFARNNAIIWQGDVTFPDGT